MSSAEDAIKRVVEAFERSRWSEIDVRWGELRVHLVSSDQPAAGSASAPLAAPPPERGDPPDEPARAARSGTASDQPPGTHVIAAPSPGIFWRSPEPGSPPFADVGDAVEASATVCIVEVMKLMNHVKAGVAGRVVAVYGENGVAVGKGQALFAIDPSGSW